MESNNTYQNGNHHDNSAPIIMISGSEKELYQDATLFDIKKREIIFESSFDPRPGSDVHIRIEDYASGNNGQSIPKSCRARVQWCKEHLDGFTFNYRIGVQLSETMTCFEN